MNNKQYQLIIDLINILLGFLISFTMVGMVILFLAFDSSFVIHSFCLFPAPLISYFISKKTKHILSFLSLHIIMIGIYFFTTNHILIQIVYCFYLVVLSINAFKKRLELEETQKINTPLVLVIAFLIMNLLSNYLNVTELNPVFFALAIIFVLLYLVNMYLINYLVFFERNSSMDNMPINQIKNTNNTLILFFSSFCFFVMLIFTQLPFGKLFSSIGSMILALIRAIVAFLFNHKEQPPVEEVEKEIVEAGNPYTMAAPSDPSPILDFILKVLQQLLMLAVAAGLIALIIYSVYKLYQQFYAKKTNNFIDKTEFISPFEKKENMDKRNSKTTFKNLKSIFGKSNNERIRKQFYKAVTIHLGSKDQISKTLTPAQLSKYAFSSESNPLLVDSIDEKKVGQLTAFYEKARYSNQECSKDEVQEVKNILK